MQRKNKKQSNDTIDFDLIIGYMQVFFFVELEYKKNKTKIDASKFIIYLN